MRPDRGSALLIRNACSPLYRRSRGYTRFFQLAGTLFAAHFNRLATDLDFDGIRIEIAVASRASFLNHDITLRYPKSG
jgi:hypothetical protein